jgi:muramoyltetrapeptide carboxypeptidase
MRDSLVIAIVAPTGYVADPESLDLAAARLTEQGHRVVIDDAARLRHQRFAGTDDERLAGLHRMIAREDVDLILAARGGYGLSRLLGRIEYERIARSGKLVVGHSDCTALLLALWARTRTPSLAGPTACFDFGGESVSDFTLREFWSALREPHRTIEGEGARGDSEPRCAVSGTLWGGNLAMLSSLVGTPYLPDVDGGILFLEDVAEHPYRIERMLLHLHHAGILDAQSAILLGDFSGYRLQDNDGGYDLGAAIDTIRGFTRAPVLTGLRYGHVRDKVSLPIGGVGQLECDGRRWTLGVTHPGGPWQRVA